MSRKPKDLKHPVSCVHFLREFNTSLQIVSWGGVARVPHDGQTLGPVQRVHRDIWFCHKCPCLGNALGFKQPRGFTHMFSLQD